MNYLKEADIVFIICVSVVDMIFSFVTRSTKVTSFLFQLTSPINKAFNLLQQLNKYVYASTVHRENKPFVVKTSKKYSILILKGFVCRRLMIMRKIFTVVFIAA